MKHTAMPVYRPTIDCIWNSFHHSGKRHLLLLGSKGRGKTQLLSRLFDPPVVGLTTWAVAKQGVYLRENGKKEAITIGKYDPSLPGTENKMVPERDGFERYGVAVLKKCMESDSDWITMDEIGYLETNCFKYQAALYELMEQKHVAAVVRKQTIPFLQELCQREDVFCVDLDGIFGNMGCVIMASGLGKRFGSNKLLADFHGEPMICKILDHTDGLFTKRVVVTRHEEILQLCEERGIPVILHDYPNRNHTIRLGLEALKDVEQCMFCPADQPLLRKETIASLALCAVNDKTSVWRTQWDGKPGAPVVFPQWTFPELMTLPEGAGGNRMIKKYPEHLRMVTVRDPYELRDIDDPMDLEELLVFFSR